MTDCPTAEPPAPVISSCASLSLQGTSPLERLPIELLRQVLDIILPQGITITFTEYQTAKMRRPKIKTSVSKLAKGEKTQLHVYVPILRICKRITEEVRCTFLSGLVQKHILTSCSAMLYCKNRFSFGTDLPLPNEMLTRLPYHSLRNIRNVQILLNARHTAEQHDKFLQHFVSIMNARNEDISRRPILKKLEVRLWVPGMDELYDNLSTFTLNDLNREMHILEILVGLPKVDAVEIFGVPAWLSQCLATCIEGGYGSVVPKLCWTMNKVKKTKTRAACHESVRLAIEPILDWTEFAEKHRIVLPESYVSFYARHNAQYPRSAVEHSLAAAIVERG
jgi:hypothetical protein